MYKENLADDFEVEEIMTKINELSKKHGILCEINKILTVVSLNGGKTYLGSIKILDENKLPKFEKKLKELLKKYENSVVGREEIVPCCSPPYTSISYKICISK
ncbi:MAG: hypothetical protein LBU74_04380 [Methanobacteriaceae archaeon]|jgi:hypothetical protein|nr:hypothetical protein [Candidatus Methanorudis spinitermitis]